MTSNTLLTPTSRRQIVVGISDCVVSADRAVSLITYALGSCIGVSAFDPVSRTGALLHLMLPESEINREKAAQNPWMFADTGVPRMLARLGASGVDSRRLVVRLAGGAQLMDQGCVFNIGKRNYLAVKKLLWKAGILISGEAVGGSVSRTVRLELATGSFFIRENGREEVAMSLQGACS